MSPDTEDLGDFRCCGEAGIGGGTQNGRWGNTSWCEPQRKGVGRRAKLTAIAAQGTQMSEPTDYLRKELIAVIFSQTFSVPEYSINIFLKRSDKFPVNLLVDTVFFFENYKWNLPIIAFISGYGFV